ncbi:MAG: respiratory nitrate reductase subunit gamma [Elusimicrobia bacterium]|nr:respiratory nitrate reductase subunit gamma [Elusimicrobiota bacterium]
MAVMKLLVGGILPYVVPVVFVAALAYKIRAWMSLASPAMTLFPACADGQANCINTAQEAVFFKSLFQGDKVLWAFAWAFHAVLLLVFIGHFRVLSGAPDALLRTAGMSEGAIQAMSSGAGGAAGVVILIATVLLLARRFAIPRVAEITGPADYLILALIAAVIITGNMMRFGSEHFDLALTREFFAAVATFSGPAQAKALENGAFVVHMLLAFMLILMIPFSKLLHFGGIFFTHQLIRKN